MNKNSIIINFSGNPDVLLELIHSHKLNPNTLQIIDLTGSLSEVQGLSIYNPMSCDENFEIKKKSHLLLAQRIGKIADKLGKYNIGGLNIFWQTNMAEKHDYYSVYGKITYFELLLEYDSKLYEYIKNAERIIISLPVNTSLPTYSLVGQLLKQVNQRASIKTNFKRIELFKHRLIIQSVFLKKVTKSLFRKKSIHPVISNNKAERDLTPFVFLTRGKTDNKQKPEYILSQRLGDKIENIDLSESMEDNFKEEKVFSLNNRINNEFINATPTKMQTLSIINKVIRLKLLFFFQRIFNNKKSSIFLKCGRNEMSRVLLNFDGLMIFTWYKNYFKEIQDKSIFLITDEFYKMGRLICNAKISSDNTNLKIVGVQHGMFGEAHTVYKITDAELRVKHPLPIPDHFIVWGEFFRSFFTKFNSLPANFVKVSSYLDFQNTHIDKNKSEKKRILWCTTLPEIALFDFNLLESLPDIDSYDVVLRQHPSFKITKFIEKKLSRDNKLWNRIILDTNETINNSIKSSDLVLTPSPSTVILDSLLNKTPALYSDCGYRICDFEDDFNAGIYIVKNQNEFNLKFNLAINQKSLDSKSLSYYVNKNKSLQKVLSEILSE